MEELIIEAAKKGDRSAIEALFDKYQKKGFKLALDILKDDLDADDAFQEAFIKAIFKLKGFKGDSSFEYWLYRIVVRECMNILRKKKRFYNNLNGNPGANLVDDIAGDDPETLENLISSELILKVNTAMEDLPKQQKTVFILRFFNDFKLEEIAGILKISVGSVKGNLFNAVKKMKTALKDFKDEC